MTLVVGPLLRLRAARPVRGVERALRRFPPVDRLAKRAYARHKRRALARLTRDPAICDAMLGRARLPSRFQEGMDERVVEYPWVLARIPTGPGRVLDAGSTLNQEWVLDHPTVASKDLVICTLAPEGVLGRRNVSYLYGDLRSMILRDAVVDSVVCISTLEHIGMDNQGYTGDDADAGNDPAAYRDAVRELRRVLRPGGTLLLTVPFGQPMDIGWLQQFDRAGLDDIVHAFRGDLLEADFFRHRPGDGWRRVSAGDCADARFVQRQGARGPVETRAEAVACLALKRPEVP